MQDQDTNPAEASAATTDFDRWITEEFARGTKAGFTSLAILLKIGERDVEPLCSTYMHVIGGEVDWGEITTLFAGSGIAWDAAVFFPHRDARSGGPLDNPTAQQHLKAQEARIAQDRLAINEGQFFDAFGRRMLVEEQAPE